MAATTKSSSDTNNNVVWKHIGLRGHSVGTIGFDKDRVLWKSAMGSDDDMTNVSRTIPASALKAAKWTVFGRSAHLRLLTKPTSINSNIKHEMRFDGFPPSDFEMLRETLQTKYGISLQQHAMSSAGTQYGLSSIVGKNLVFKHCVLDEMNEEGQEFEPRAQDEMLSLDLAEVSQCVLPGNNRNEIELQFPESDTVEAGTDQLVAIRMYIPPDLEADPADKEADTAAELLQQRIMQTANIRKTTGDVIVSFEASKGTFLTPRGRYAIELYDRFLRMRGQKYDYKIQYDDISRLFLLPKPDEVHMAFVIALDKPIRQGQQRYQYLVLQAAKDPDEVQVNLEEAVLQKEYNGELQPVMRGSLPNLIAKTFKVIAKKKVFIPGKFSNANQQPCVKCAVRANEGLLYPLEKQFVFIHKPPILVRFNEVESVEFQRYAGATHTRNFDFCVNLKSSAVSAGGQQNYTFSGIDRSDYQGLYDFLNGKKITIKNLEDGGFSMDVVEEPSSRGRGTYNEADIYGGPDDDELGEGSDDEDYDEAAAAKEEAEAAAEDSDDDSEDDVDDDEMGSEIDDELDSDLEEARGKKRKKPARDKDEEDSDDDDDDDEEEKPKKKKKSTKKKGSSPDTKKKAKKDPNAPKGVSSSYIMFSKENRDRIKEANEGMSTGDISKVLGAEWKKMTDDQKQKYNDMAEEDKKRYKNEMKDYVPPAGLESGGKKAKGKKAKKDPNAPKRATTAYFYFSNDMRPKLKEENPEMTFGELGKKLGELFRALSPEEKKPYEEQADKDKARYSREMAKYKAKGKGKGDDDDDDEEEDTKNKDDGVDDSVNDNSDDDSDDSDD